MTVRQLLRLVLAVVAVVLAVVLACLVIFGHPSNVSHLLAWGLIADGCGLLVLALL
jgi:hypothetical protein